MVSQPAERLIHPKGTTDEPMRPALLQHGKLRVGLRDGWPILRPLDEALQPLDRERELTVLPLERGQFGAGLAHGALPRPLGPDYRVPAV